jgi:hypothetical protein
MKQFESYSEFYDTYKEDHLSLTDMYRYTGVSTNTIKKLIRNKVIASVGYTRLHMEYCMIPLSEVEVIKKFKRKRLK